MHIEELMDRVEIEDLVRRLGACLDERRFDDLQAVLADDVTARTPGGLAEGRDAVIAQARRNHPAEDRIQHVISDVLIDLDGDRAAVRANLIATFVRRDTASRPHMTLGEIYRFGARRTPDGWRLASVETQPVWAAVPDVVDLGALTSRAVGPRR
jgi:3-phenylpropionate/cinnamic acid dioxygenase small subunit